VTQVFNEFVASDYERDGIKEFFRFANPSAMRERMQSGGFVLVAYQADVLVGMLEFFLPDCIAMLFVTVRHQGIATELLCNSGDTLLNYYHIKNTCKSQNTTGKAGGLNY